MHIYIYYIHLKYLNIYCCSVHSGRDHICISIYIYTHIQPGEDNHEQIKRISLKHEYIRMTMKKKYI